MKKNVLYLTILYFLYSSIIYSYDIISVESAGRGGTFVAIPGDYTNPAGLDNVDRNKINCEYSSMIEGMNIQSISLIFPTQFTGGFGFQVDRIDYGTFEIRNDAGDILRKFSWSDIRCAFSYGKRIYKEMYFGSALKFLNIDLGNFSKANGFSFDVGLFYQPFDILSVGMKAEDLLDVEVKDTQGLTQKISSFALHSGIAFMPGKRWKLAVDIESKKKNVLNSISAGGEVKISNFILRGGVTFYPKGGKSVSTGFGYKLGKNLLIDYALLYGFDINTTLRVSLSIEFGPSSYARKHLYKGSILMKQGQWDEAIVEFMKVLEVEPDNKDALFNQYYAQGVLFYKDGKLKEALEVWGKASSIKPEEVEIKGQIAKVKKELEDKEREELKKLRERIGKIAVLDFEAMFPLSTELGLSVSENLRTALSEKFDVVERKYIMKVAEEQKLQMSGLIDTNTAVQFGKLIGAKTVVLGSITKIGKTYTLNVRFVSVETGEVVKAKPLSCESEDELPELIKEVVEILSQGK
jgi:tetratricopeptide (TPR) repeat protein